MESIVRTTGRPPPIVRRPARLPLSPVPPPSADGVPCGDRIEGLLAFDGRDADEGRDASTVKSAKFGQLGNERCDHDGADAWDGLEPAIGLRQFGIGLDDRAHACGDLGDAAIEHRDEASRVGAGFGISGLLQPARCLLTELAARAATTIQSSRAYFH